MKLIKVVLSCDFSKFKFRYIQKIAQTFLFYMRTEIFASCTKPFLALLQVTKEAEQVLNLYRLEG